MSVPRIPPLLLAMPGDERRMLRELLLATRVVELAIAAEPDPGKRARMAEKAERLAADAERRLGPVE